MNWVVLTFEHPQCLIIKKIKNDRFRKKNAERSKLGSSPSHTHKGRNEKKRRLDPVLQF